MRPSSWRKAIAAGYERVLILEDDIDVRQVMVMCLLPHLTSPSRSA